MHQSTTMSYTYGDDDSGDFVDHNAAISRVPGVLDSKQLQQVAGITEEMLRMMKTAVNDTSDYVTRNIMQQIEELKRQKTRNKYAFTKARRAMLVFFDKDLPSRREKRSRQQKVEDCQEKALSIMEALMDMYTAVGDQESVKKNQRRIANTGEGVYISSKQSARISGQQNSRAHGESRALSSRSSGKSTRRSMSKVKEDRIEQWR